MRSRFDEQLAHLDREMIEMGGLCEQAIRMASKAMVDGDVGLADRVIAMDNDIDRMERAIEARCLKLLLQQQPVAHDLRQISAALKMITDLERIGDQAADIAEISRFLKGHNVNTTHIVRMADAACGMVSDAIDAFVRRDNALAQAVIERDDVVDSDFIDIKNALIRIIAKDPKEGGHALDLIMIAKYLERIGDHATNLAEWVQFADTGVHKEVDG